jgi:hypothetical protein
MKPIVDGPLPAEVLDDADMVLFLSQDRAVFPARSAGVKGAAIDRDLSDACCPLFESPNIAVVCLGTDAAAFINLFSSGMDDLVIHSTTDST